MDDARFLSEIGGIQSAVPNVQFDHLGLSCGRIQANNTAVFFLPLS